MGAKSFLILILQYKQFFKSLHNSTPEEKLTYHLSHRIEVLLMNPSTVEAGYNQA